jgi:hypothetical protein
MAKKHKISGTKKVIFKDDFSSWNFIIFLTLSFMLLVFVVASLSGVSEDLRTRAGLACPKISMPDPKSCSGGWTYTTATNGCPTFICQ